MKLVVKEPSEKRKRRQLLPTPVEVMNKNPCQILEVLLVQKLT